MNAERRRLLAIVEKSSSEARAPSRRRFEMSSSEARARRDSNRRRENCVHSKHGSRIEQKICYPLFTVEKACFYTPETKSESRSTVTKTKIENTAQQKRESTQTQRKRPARDRDTPISSQILHNPFPTYIRLRVSLFFLCKLIQFFVLPSLFTSTDPPFPSTPSSFYPFTFAFASLVCMFYFQPVFQSPCSTRFKRDFVCLTAVLHCVRR